MDTVFQAADILLPEKTIDMEKWSVIAIVTSLQADRNIGRK